MVSLPDGIWGVLTGSWGVLAYLVLLKKFELVIPWWLGKRVLDMAVFKRRG